MTGTRTRIVGGVLASVLIVGGAGFALASNSDGEHDEPLTGSDLAHATRAALDRTGGGTVVDSEMGDDGAAYSVEIRLDDGRIVEVNLDERFQVIGSGSDEDGPTEGTGSGED